MRKFGIMKYVMTVAGVGLMVIAFYMHQDTQRFLQAALTTNGQVVDMERKRSDDSYVYRPVVQFVTPEGRSHRFASSMSSNPPAYSVGEGVTVIYDPSRPDKAKIQHFISIWGGFLIIGGLGLGLTALGITLIVLKRRKAAKTEWLKEEGLCIETQVQRVEENHSLSVNDRHPFRITTQWLDPATLQAQTFTSDNIWFDPSDRLTTDTINVYIERGNPENYMMDLDFLN